MIEQLKPHRATLLAAIATITLLTLAMLARLAHGERMALAQSLAGSSLSEDGAFRVVHDTSVATPSPIAPAPLADSPVPGVPDMRTPHTSPAEDPLTFWQEVKAIRRTGGLWIAVGFFVAVLAGLVKKWSAPADGTAPPGWRARSYAIAGAVSMSAGAVVDWQLGAGSLATVLTVVLAAIALVRSAFNAKVQ